MERIIIFSVLLFSNLIVHAQACVCNAGLDQAICGLSINQEAIVKSGDHNTYWSYIGNVSGVIIADTTSPTTLVTVPASGYYKFLWTITNSIGTTCSDTVKLKFTNIPTSTFDFTPIHCFGDSTILTYTGVCDSLSVFNWNYDGGIVNGNSITWSTYGAHFISLSILTNICSSTSTTQNIINPYPLMVNVSWVTNTFCGDSSGVIITNVSGGMPSYSYHWSNSSVSAFLVHVSSGTYSCTVTDSYQCTNTITQTINDSSININFITNLNNPNCLNNYGNVTISAINGNAPFIYSLNNNISNSGMIDSLLIGLYHVTVTDSNGCKGYDTIQIFQDTSFVVNILGQPILCHDGFDTLTVHLGCGTPPFVYSWNQGIIADSVIIVSPTITVIYTVTVTDAIGHSISDSFTVVVNPHCGNIISGNVFLDENGNGIQDVNENGIQNKLIKITPGPSYAITDSMGFYISHNAGIDNYLISIPYPGYFSLIPASNTAVFTILGNTDSLNNFAFQPIPVNDLSISAFDNAAHPGFSYNVTINCFNNGADTLNTILKLKFSNFLNYQSSFPNINSQNNDTLIWNINNFLPHSYITFYAYFNIPTNIFIGDTILLKAIILPVSSDTLLSNNTFNLTRIITGSYDPNYKFVTPDKYISLAQVQQRRPLYYTIHFQNTGTDTAYTVRVTDTVSTNLDIESFQMLFASHPYSVQIRNNNILEWKFENILLPDSNTNEPQSHGFVHFSLIPKEYLLVNDVILNSSNIYFDFNTPVITNTAIDTVCETLTQIKNSNNTISDNMVMVYPNPFIDETNIILNLEKQSLTEINLFSTIGHKIKSIYKGVLLQGSNKIILKNNFNLIKGFYFLEVKIETQVYYQKLYIY